MQDTVGLLSKEALAEYLSVPVGTVDEWMAKGTAPSFHRVGKHVRFSLEDVHAWLETRKDLPHRLDQRS